MGCGPSYSRVFLVGRILTDESGTEEFQGIGDGYPMNAELFETQSDAEEWRSHRSKPEVFAVFSLERCYPD